MAETQKNMGVEEYEARKQWAVKTAKDLGIEYHKDTDPDHFQIPFFDDTGQEIRREFLPTWDAVPLQDASGTIQKPAKIEETVAAIKQFPNENLHSAITKLRAQSSK